MKLIHADCLEFLKQLKNNSVDSIVCDPPYGINFMNKGWDKHLPFDEIWKECLRILKLGGHIIAMSSARTYHLLAQQIEKSGFTTYPMLGWIYGTGFPKATDLSKQFDKQSGVTRKKGKVLRTDPNMKGGNYNNSKHRGHVEIR